MKRFAPLALALAAALTAGTAAAQDKVVRITYVSSPFNVPSIVMRDLGYLDEAFKPFGVKVEAPEITSGAAQTQAIAAGEVDIASVLGGSSAILGKANGIDLKIIAAYARSPKAYYLMTRADGPKTLADLKGKNIAGPKGTVLHQLLASALASQKLGIGDVEHINMDLPTARAALLAGKVDVATLAGANAVAVQKAGGRILTSGEGLIKPTTVIGASGKFVRENPQLVAAYFAAHSKALAFMAANPDKAIELAAKDQKLSVEDARAQFPLYDFTTTLTDEDITNLEEDQTFMVEAAMLPKAKAISIRNDLVDPSALPKK